MADGTFNMVRDPMKQCWTASAHLGDDNGENVRAVPLAHAIMSRKKKEYYTAVLKALKTACPDNAMEGAHNRWNSQNQERVNLNLYELIHFLHSEA